MKCWVAHAIYWTLYCKQKTEWSYGYRRVVSVLVVDFHDCIPTGSCGRHCLASPKGTESYIASRGEDPNSSTVSTEYHFCTMVKSKNLTSTRCKQGLSVHIKVHIIRRGGSGAPLKKWQRRREEIVLKEESCQHYSEPQSLGQWTGLMLSPHLFEYHSLGIN